VHRPDGTVQRAAFRAKANVLPQLHVSFMTPIASFDPPVQPSGRRLLTLCAWSKQVKLDEIWMPIEQFLYNHLEFEISHGISPRLAAKYFP